MVGGLLGGLMVELLSLGAKPAAEQAGPPRHHRHPERVLVGHRSRRHPPPHQRRRLPAGPGAVRDRRGANVFRQGPGRNPGGIHRAARRRAQHLRDAPRRAAADGTGQMSYTHPDSMRGHVAIVTGAAQGVGKGIAAALLERGAAVLLVDILDEKLAATTDELRGDWAASNKLVADLRDPRQRPADRRGRGRRLRHGARAGQQRHRHQRAQGVRRHHHRRLRARPRRRTASDVPAHAGRASADGRGGRRFDRQPRLGDGHRRRAQVGRLRRRQGSHPRAVESRRAGMGPRQHPRQRHLPVRRIRRRQTVEAVRARRVRQGGGTRSDEAHRRCPHRRGRAGGVPAQHRRDLHHRADHPRRRWDRLLP